MKTVVITGASKGIGRATAQTFINAGDRVINLARTRSDVTGVQNYLLDLTGEDAARDVQGFVDSQLEPGEIVLIHNAAKLTVETVTTIDIAEYQSVIALNLVAPAMLNKAIIPLMAQGSSVIYVGSTLSEKGVPNSFSYVVTKHGLVGAMRATCQDLAGSGIHTVCVCPGFTDTEMLRAHVGDSQEILDSIAGASSFNRLIAPDEIASTIHFAASSPVLNGAVIHANLGQIEN